MDINSSRSSSVIPHVLIFPLPLQGPVNCMLKLAEILCLAAGDLHVTFLNTDHIHSRLLSHSDVLSRFARFPNFLFRTFPDRLPADNPRSAGQVLELFQSMDAFTKPLFRDLLTLSMPPVTCIIADGFFSFALDVADEVGISLLYFETISPSCLWIFLCLDKLIEEFEQSPLKDDLDARVSGVPGMEEFLRLRDLPNVVRSLDVADPHVQLALRESQQIQRARGLILNTFEELEGRLLSHMRTRCTNLYAIGPLHTHHKNRQPLSKISQKTSSSNSLWEEDHGCMTWLDSQPPKSVLYVSFGSLTMITGDQLTEFWHGLVNSGTRFLWVRRPGSIVGGEETVGIPAGLEEGTRERGYIVRWAPQEKVLAHPAVGGFLTHNGWNSTLESIVEGVPMICWPYFVDQHVNGRLVSEVWKVGMDMNGMCDRKTVEEIVRDLMEVRRGEFFKKMDHMAKLARKSVSEDGSSYFDMNHLIEDIRCLSLLTTSRALKN